jgi:hypothetical protein
MKAVVLLSIVFGLSFSARAATIGEVANHYTTHLGDFGSSTAIMKRSPLNRGGEMRPKTVLKGVFYFGGSDLKRKALSGSTQNFLCDSGFSAAYSVYDTPSSSRVSCNGNAMSYSKIGQASSGGNGGSKVRALMEHLYRVIKNPGTVGPVYLHCWYGVHASNTIAQMVLKQFCGYSDSQLARNWDAIDIYNSLGASGVRKNIQKIHNFQPYRDLQITAEERQAICY